MIRLLILGLLIILVVVLILIYIELRAFNLNTLNIGNGTVEKPSLFFGHDRGVGFSENGGVLTIST